VEYIHTILNQRLYLLPEKAIYWEEQNAILIADLHLGKITHFRKSGIAVPKGPDYKNWLTLTCLIQTYNPEKIIILGDLFHSNYNQEWKTFLEVIDAYSKIEWILVKGNHDILSKGKYESSGLVVYDDKLDIGPFRLVHEPLSPHELKSYDNKGYDDHNLQDDKLISQVNIKPNDDFTKQVHEMTNREETDNDMKYILCGHIHPAIRLQGTGRQSARVPCFYFSKHQAILPAFGAFTGMYTIQPKEQDQVFLVVQNKVLNASEMFV